MKNKTNSLIGRMIIAASFFLVAASGANAQENYGGGRLAGTWDAAVTIRNCATGDAIASFASIGTFNAGGTFIGSTSGLAQASRTPEHGVWRHVSANVYMMRFKTFSFDTAGVATGYSVVTHQIELSKDADSYTSAGTVQFFLMNGTQVGQGCSDAIGTRFEL
jgi:hypothetical protein